MKRKGGGFVQDIHCTVQSVASVEGQHDNTVCATTNLFYPLRPSSEELSATVHQYTARKTCRIMSKTRLTKPMEQHSSRSRDNCKMSLHVSSMLNIKPLPERRFRNLVLSTLYSLLPGVELRRVVALHDLADDRANEVILRSIFDG